MSLFFYWPEHVSYVTLTLDMSRYIQNLCSLLAVPCPQLCTSALHPLFYWEHCLIFSISSKFISKIAPIFPKTHFILCMLKRLLSSAYIFLIKAMLNGWAIARGKIGWWWTKMTSEQQINYSLRKVAAIKDKVRPGGNAFSQWLCNISPVWCCQSNMLEFKHSNISQQHKNQRNDVLQRLHFKCCSFLGKKIDYTKERSQECSIWFKWQVDYSPL